MTFFWYEYKLISLLLIYGVRSSQQNIEHRVWNLTAVTPDEESGTEYGALKVATCEYIQCNIEL